MKTKRSIKALQIGINIVLFAHVIMVLLMIVAARFSWDQTNVKNEDLNGAVNLHRSTRVKGLINRSFEYEYEHADTSNPEKHLYTTDIAHLEPIGNSSINMKYKDVSYTSSGVHVNYQISRLPLKVPVSKSQKRTLVYYVFGISVFIILYSFIIFYQLKRFIQSVFSHKSFTIKNIRILFSLGILVTAAPILNYLAESIELKWITSQYVFANYSIYSEIHFQFSLFGIGILILTITEVIRQGIILKEEIELTV